MLVASELDGSIRRAVGQSTRRERHLGIQAEGGHRDLGKTLGGELGFIDDDFLNLRVRRTSPSGSQWCCHGEEFDWVACLKLGSLDCICSGVEAKR